MKNIKIVLISIIVIGMLCNSQFIKSAPIIEIYNKQETGPDFVRFMIKDEVTGKQIASPYVKRNQQWNSGDDAIDTNHEIEVEVWPEANQRKRFIIKSSGKKTIYLSWNPAKSKPLYPQTGPLMGLMGKTESGLTLDKKTNVADEEIKPGEAASLYQPSTQPKSITQNLQQKTVSNISTKTSNISTPAERNDKDQLEKEEALMGLNDAEQRLEAIKNGALGAEYAQKATEVCSANYTQAEKLGKINLCSNLKRNLVVPVYRMAERAKKKGIVNPDLAPAIEDIKNSINSLHNALSRYKSRGEAS